MNRKYIILAACIAVILAAVLVFIIIDSSINTTNINFAECLDASNMRPGMSQTELRDLSEQYSYKGKSLAELTHTIYSDSMTGGGCKMTGEHFGFTNDYRVDEQGFANYNNSFYTDVNLDGLILPYRIRFNDNLERVLQKIGLNTDVLENFTPDLDTENKMTLLQNDHYSIVLTDHTRTAGEPRYAYTIAYIEAQESIMTDGRSLNSTSMISLQFDENCQLVRFIISTKQYYPTQQSKE